jgi:hypothetical protein
MASIVKANYRHAKTGGREAAVKAVNYYAYRLDASGCRVRREGFSRDEDSLSASVMRGLIRQAEGEYYYRIMLSPGDHKDTHVDLKEWTRDSLLALEKDLGEFTYVAIEHRDQTDHAHVHVVLVIDQKLSKDDLENLRDTCTTLYEERRDWLEPSKDLPQRDHSEREVNNYIDYSDGYVAPYNDEPDRMKHLKKDVSKSLYR